jgi:UDP-3-O-[3-hydroxymyristoyl] glucosamine N-acyltransferase
MNRRFTLGQLAERVGGTLRGEDSAIISGVADLAEAGPSDASWLTSERYASKLASSRAGVVLGPVSLGPSPMPVILCEKVERAVARLLGAFAPPEIRPDVGVHPAAVVHPTAQMGNQVAIGAGVFVDRDVRIGAGTALHPGVYVGRGTILGQNCVLWPNVVIRDGCTLGSRVVIHPNAVIGADGLGFYFDEGRFHKVPHIGGVWIEDDVEIGAGTCVDRAKFGNTVIGRGTKIDNLVQIGHNVRLGEHCVLAGQSGLSGSVRVGNRCMFGGRSGAVDNVTVGDDVRVALASAVTKDVPAGMSISGFPAVDIREDLREKARVRRLADILEDWKALIARVERLEASMHDRA